MSSEIDSPPSKKRRRFPRIRIGSHGLPVFSRRYSTKSEKRDGLSETSLDGTTSSVAVTASVEVPKPHLVTAFTADTSAPETNSTRNEETGESSKACSNSLECPLCLVSQPLENFPQLSTCPHRSCMDCLRQYLAIEISESRVNLMCPECQERLHPTDMKHILEHEPQLMLKWEEFTLRRALSIDPDCRWCPAPDCGFAVIAYRCASCPKIRCRRDGCNTEFCYHCRQEWHPNQTCDSAHLQRTKQLRIRSNSVAYSQGSNFHDEIKPCPKCGALIVKMNDGSCNHMTCTVCEAEFCWLCLQEITDLHYLSPSGCTFWGKKPWSRKKKILWQLGLLIGAPLGIGLVAGIAIPAIIVGLPVWVARRIIAQFENRDIAKYKRNLLVAACVTGSVILSPALAALAVGVGVPVMLLYVYGVVPFSLCRTGSYGIQQNNMPDGSTALTKLPFRLDLGSTGSQPATLEALEKALSGRSSAAAANPSIGEASVGGMTMGSFNLSHGSNMDRVGRNDTDAGSTIAMAGTSITGSLSAISGFGAMGSNRVTIHTKDADQQSTHTQASVCSSANVTSVQVHMNDNVSENSISSVPPSSVASSSIAVKKSFSVGSKRKAKHAKRSSSSIKNSVVKRSTDESHGLPPVDDTYSTQAVDSVAMTTKSRTLSEDRSSLTIVNECDVDAGSPKKILMDGSASDSSSCGSGNALLNPASQAHSTSVYRKQSLTKKEIIV